MQSVPRERDRLDHLAAPKRLRGTTRGKTGLALAKGSSNRPSTAGTSPSASSRYWRAGASAGQPDDQEQQQLWIGRPPSKGSWMSDRAAAQDSSTAYESRMQALTASAARPPRDGAAGGDGSLPLTVKRGSPAVALRQRPNSSGVYSKKNADNRAQEDGYLLGRAELSQSMPVFQLPNALTAANQREDGGRRGTPVIVRRSSTDLSKPSSSEEPSRPMMRSESYSGSDPQRTPFSGYGSSAASHSTVPADSGIEIYAPPRRPAPSAAEQFSVSPITIQHMEVDNAQGGAGGAAPSGPALRSGIAWDQAGKGQELSSDDRATAASASSKPSSNLPELNGAAASAQWQRSQACSPLMGSPATSSSKHFMNKNGATESTKAAVNGTGKPSDQSANISSETESGGISGGNGLFALRGSSFTPVVDNKADSSSNGVSIYKQTLANRLDEISNVSSSSSDSLPAVDADPPSPGMRYMVSPLAERKQFAISPQKHQAIKMNTEWKPAEKVKPILRKPGATYMKKGVKFDLNENSYSEHVPYVSPPKQMDDSYRARAMAASMRTPLIPTTGSSPAAYGYLGGYSPIGDLPKSGSVSSAASNTAGTIAGKSSGLSAKHRNSILLKYSGGSYSSY